MSAAGGRADKQVYGFGPFQLDAEKQTLLRDGELIALAPKAFQLLLTLVRHGTETVSKDQLMKSVWPDTFVEETNLTRNVFALRKALGESDQNRYIVTVPGRGYRFAEGVRLLPDAELSIVAASHSKVQVEVKETTSWTRISIATVILLTVAAVAVLLLMRRSPALTGKDTVVLADFANSTGDPVFDGTLRQGMEVQLEQSPFLSLVPEQRVRRTLAQMGQPTDTRLGGETAREVCERTGAVATIEGSIAMLGSEYVLGLRAKNCRTTGVLDAEQEQAHRKEDVLKALSVMTTRLRARMGESLASVEKYSTPLAEVTTPSLEALKAYSAGRQIHAAHGAAAALPFLRRATEMAPQFAVAHTCLGRVYAALAQSGLAAVSIALARHSRDRVSDRERFFIDVN
jgi:DNA-binding winged helix-turn-helix (wHTH) protein